MNYPTANPGNFIEDDVIAPLIKDVVDPVVQLIDKALVSGVEELATLAEKAFGVYKPAPTTAPAATTGQASPDALTALANGVKAGIDVVVTEAVGSIPVAGAILAPEAVDLANQAFDDVESKGVALVQSLIAKAKDKLQTFLANPGPGTPAIVAAAETAAATAMSATTKANAGV